MIPGTRSNLATIFALLLLAAGAAGAELKAYSGAGCAAVVDEFFADEVWVKVGAHSCLKCHKPGGDADESKFVLHDPRRSQGQLQAEAMRHNLGAFTEMARLKEGDQSRLLLKAAGKLKHGGEEVLTPDSGGYRVLSNFVRRVNSPPDAWRAGAMTPEKNAPPFFDGIVMLDDRKLLRRATLSLAGRLPTDTELAAVEKEKWKALPAILDRLMTEEAFFDRLREGFNDIFLTVGYDDVPENALSYEHFSKTRGWAEKFPVEGADEKAKTQARYKVSADSRKAMLGEPMKLIEHIVRNDRPFSEIITADYIMVTPYTARGDGIYEELKDQFENPDDPYEYVPVKLKALVARTHDDDQESASGFYPHAGIL